MTLNLTLNSFHAFIAIQPQLWSRDLLWR